MPNIIDSSSILCKDIQINNSTIGKKAVIGDFSRIRNCQIADFCSIDRQNFVMDSAIGGYSYTGPWNMIFKCSIGKFCSISYGVTIGPPEHNYKLLSTHPFIYRSKYDLFDDDESIEEQRFEKKLIIGNDVWIGCNSVIARGITIGDGAVIGANSFVNRDVPPYAIVGGSPAKQIKFRFSDDIIKKLKEIEWWNQPIEKIKHCKFFFSHEINLELLKKLQKELYK